MKQPWKVRWTQILYPTALLLSPDHQKWWAATYSKMPLSSIGSTKLSSQEPENNASAETPLKHNAKIPPQHAPWHSHHSQIGKIKLKCEAPCCKSTNFLRALSSTCYLPKAQKWSSSSTENQGGIKKQGSWGTMSTALNSLLSQRTVPFSVFWDLVSKRQRTKWK